MSSDSLGELIDKLESLRERLDGVQAIIAEHGRLASAISIERAMMRVQMLADRLALFGEMPADVDKTAAAEIDRRLAYHVDQAWRIVFLLTDSATRQEALSGLVDDLLATLEEINTAVSRRRDLVRRGDS